MKRILFLFVFSALCYAGKAQVMVGADHSFKAPIRDYKTFTWSESIDNIPKSAIYVGDNNILIFNNESTRSKIKKDIKFELQAKGYKYVPSGADMIVLYRVTEKAGTLTTYHGYQLIDEGLDSVRTTKDIKKVHIKPGTLVVNIVDAKSSKLAWQGWASGILKPGMVNNSQKMKEAVAALFAKYQYKAKM